MVGQVTDLSKTACSWLLAFSSLLNSPWRQPSFPDHKKVDSTNTINTNTWETWGWSTKVWSPASSQSRFPQSVGHKPESPGISSLKQIVDGNCPGIEKVSLGIVLTLKEFRWCFQYPHLLRHILALLPWLQSVWMCIIMIHISHLLCHTLMHICVASLYIGRLPGHLFWVLDNYLGTYFVYWIITWAPILNIG